MKKALCIGINDYPGTQNDLAGCVNDANDWGAELAARGFAVTKMIDTQATHAAMRGAIGTLIQGAVSGDTLVITYSGHGTWVPDSSGDEADGRDEGLCPYDIGSAGPLLDDDDAISAAIERFDWHADPDGRYRINECYCFDYSWQAALHALVARSAVVLIDLRGFTAENRGCRHELGVLASAAHLRRVVVLHDSQTARAIADADIGSAAAGRFTWLPAERMDSATAGRVLAALFATAR